MSELINNRQKRIEQLKQVITGLHTGETPEFVKARLSALVSETTSDEIVAMEHQLIEEGMDPSEIKAMCDLHSEVVREVLSAPVDPPIPLGHPVDTFRRENTAITHAIDEMQELLDELSGRESTDGLESLIDRWRQSTEKLLEIEKHYARKENLVFPHLEQHGVAGPSQVMWAKDDDVREMLRALRQALAEESAGLGEWQLVGEHVATPLLAAMLEMIFKEEKILLPAALDLLEPDEWGAIYREGKRYGYCLVKPNLGYSPAEPATPDPSAESAAAAAVALGTGQVTPEQLKSILGILPFDMTFVDADDRVGFFSEGPDRVFPRTNSIIGRKVHNCHPPHSVHIVERILADFRSQKEDVAEFWIQMGPRFVHIRYFAVRNPQKDYLGCLEVTQDLTRLRALEGERRLLAWVDTGEEG